MTSTRVKPSQKSKPVVRLRIPLHAGQQEVRRHPARFKTVACGRQWGKTRLGCPYAFKRALEGGRVWIVGPDYPRAQIDWRIVRGFARQLPFCEIKESEKRIEFPNGGFLEVKSAHGEDRLRGPTLDLVVVDEAAFIDEERWTKELRATLSVRKGEALFLSTFYGKNWFYGLYQRGQADHPDHPDHREGWMSWRHPSVDNPYIDEAEIEEARIELPEDVFAQEYLADPLVQAGAIYDRDWWQNQNRWNQAMRDVPSTPENPNPNIVVARWISWDMALKDKNTSAYNALTVFELTADYHLDVRYAWRDKLSFPKLMPVVTETAYQWNHDGKLFGLIVEDKAHGITALQTIEESADEWLKGMMIPFDPGDRSKEIRWNQAAVWARNGCVRLPEPSAEHPWLHAYEEELLSLPNAAYKDWSDTFAQGVVYLEPTISQGFWARRNQGVA